MPLSKFWRGVLGWMVLCSTAGCTQALFTAAYLIRGTDEPPEFDGLKEKRVVVVCRAPATMNPDHALATEALARRVSQLLRRRVSDIQLIPPEKVAKWTDEHSWDEFTEVGEALGAEMVVGIDLLDFSLYRSSTVYQGRADIAVIVYDMTRDGEIVFEKAPLRVLYPSTGIPTTVPRAQFRRVVVNVIAEDIGKLFYPHDRTADFARDGTALPYQ